MKFQKRYREAGVTNPPGLQTRDMGKGSSGKHAEIAFIQLLGPKKKSRQETTNNMVGGIGNGIQYQNGRYMQAHESTSMKA